jgi:type IV secretory pathway VirB6-like protein
MADVNQRLEGAVEERPLLKHLLDFRTVGWAVLVSVVLTLICLLFSAILAAIVLVVSFFATWIFLGMRSYEKRRPTREQD